MLPNNYFRFCRVIKYILKNVFLKYYNYIILIKFDRQKTFFCPYGYLFIMRQKAEGLFKYAFHWFMTSIAIIYYYKIGI